MNATSGPTSTPPYASYDHNTYSWKTYQDTALWGSTPYSETLPKAGTMQNGQLYERQMSELRTTANDSLSSPPMPTPIATDCKRDNCPAAYRLKSPPLTATQHHFPDGTVDKYADRVRQWESIMGTCPNPVDERNKTSIRFLEWVMGYPQEWTEGTSRKSQVQAIGNAVCPPQAKAAITELLERNTH